MANQPPGSGPDQPTPQQGYQSGPPASGSQNVNPIGNEPPGNLTISEMIYNALINAGATPVQAAAIMGNMYAESSFDPESQVMDSNNAMSRGLVMWNDKGAGAGVDWSKYITGNVQNDINNQVALLISQGALAAASGADAGTAAANFMHNFERPANDSSLGKRVIEAQTVFAAASGQPGATWAGVGTGSAVPSGGVPPTGGGVAPAASTAPASTTIGQIGLAQAQANYPELAWMLTIPDAASDINTWAAGDYTPDEIAARLQGKPWYQRLGASFFTWIAQQATNPSQATQTFQEQLAAVKQTFTQLGLQPSPQQLQTFAYQALAQDWTNHPELEQQAIAGTIAVNKDGTFSVRNFAMVGGQLQSTFIGPQGNVASTNSADYQTTMPASYVAHGLVTQIGTTTAGGGFNAESITKGAPVYALIGGQLQQNYNIKNLAPGTPLYTLPNFVTGPKGQAATGAESNMAGSLQNAQQVFENAAGTYLVPMSKQGAANLVQQAIAGGTTDIATMAKTYFQAQAKSLYPSMAAAIDAGITPQAYTDPYRQVVANLLGTSPDAISMMNPIYQRFITHKDPKTGMPTAMSLYDAQQLVMSDPVYGYMKSQPAMDRAAALAQGLGEMFGRTPSSASGFSGVQAPAA